MTPKTLTKRAFLGYGASGVTLAALAGVGSLGGGFGATAANAGGPIAKGDFPISYSTEEWRRRLTDKEFYILREAGTERPGTSPLNAEKRRGIFACAACGNYVYTSLTKFESNTGWPSFWAPVKDGVGYADDRSLFITRTEVHCAVCGGHLGHVFDDGPRPTGKRHCINGAALDFIHKPKTDKKGNA